mgnify:CR=1 FL=1
MIIKSLNLLKNKQGNYMRKPYLNDDNNKIYITKCKKL